MGDVQERGDPQEPPAGLWSCAPREVLSLVFRKLPQTDRCLTVAGVCSWWRAVLLEEGASLLQELNLNRAPLFAQRTRSLPDFYAQRASFIAWLLRRRGCIKRLSLTAERWEDDSQAVVLRMAVAEVVAPALECLRLVSTESGRATSAFLQGAVRLKELHLDFWGRSNCLPRHLAECTALTKLSVQCSSGLERHKVLASLTALQDLSVVDADWQRLPPEALQLPLTRLMLRFADFAGDDWLPADLGRLGQTLEELSLPGCQISTLPEGLTRLSALTSLCLDRNYFRALPAALSSLALHSLSLEGCASVRELPAALALALPLRSLNLLNTGVVRLPLASSGRRLTSPADGASTSSAAEAEADERPASAGSAPAYLKHLTELRWGVPEWEASAGQGRPSGGALRWVAPSGALAGAGTSSGEGASSASSLLPDLEPLCMASALRVLQLSHVPAGAEERVAELRRCLPALARLQVNSAVLLGS